MDKPYIANGLKDTMPAPNQKSYTEHVFEKAKERAIKPAETERGLRFNKGKLRYDLLHYKAQEGIVKVLTKGAEKYAPRNWEKGMPWMEVMASMKRHIAAWESGEDYDPETGLLHVDHIQCNAHFLSAFYSIAPQYDDRPHKYLAPKKIGLDIDEVLCDWVGEWSKKFGYPMPNAWYFSYNNKEHFDSFTPEELFEFYINLPSKIRGEDLPFEPHCYITSRSIPQSITEKWLQKNGFPTKPVYTVGFGNSKVEVAKKSGIEVFVDDAYHNFVELNNAGILTYLYDTPQNRKYNVGHKRIYSLRELPFVI